MKYFKIKLLVGVLLTAFLTSCDSETPLPEDFVPEINGGHQAIVEDRDIVFYYGLFNVEGEASSSFKKGEEIYFSFWVENKSDIDYGMVRPIDNKFMQVFYEKAIDNAELIGRPYEGFCNQVNLRWPIEKQSIIKGIAIPWYSFGKGAFYCNPREGELLEAGDYYTSIIKTFEFCDAQHNCYLTDEIILRVDFEVIE
jgi:hypothetical protein